MKKKKKMRKNPCFWNFAGNIGGFGNVAKNAEMAFSVVLSINR
jgi:hypothetical protein